MPDAEFGRTTARKTSEVEYTSRVLTIRDLPFAPPSVLPFRAGTSPFRQKGNAYLADARYLDEVVPGGFRAVLSALVDADVRAFFEQSFRASDWYDAYPGSVLEATAARLRGLSFEQHRKQTGAWHAVGATRGIYGTLLKLVSAENVALWGPRISSMYFEFGKTETRAAGEHTVDAWRRGVPRELAQWLFYASAGFCAEALRLTGAEEPVVTAHEVEDDGSSHGRELVRFRARITWK
jgi:hypothetical protein